MDVLKFKIGKLRLLLENKKSKSHSELDKEKALNPPKIGDATFNLYFGRNDPKLLLS